MNEGHCDSSNNDSAAHDDEPITATKDTTPADASAAAAAPTTTIAVETWQQPTRISFPYGVVGTSVHGIDLIDNFNMMDYIGKGCRKRNAVRLERQPEWNDCDDPQAHAPS
jgi:hypothetical protein